MLRDRLIFSLIYNDGAFMQSRNFRLQRVGDINWLERNYEFQKISFSLDELVVLNASRQNKNIVHFSQVVKRLVDDVFIPVAAGGGIRSLEDAEKLFLSGADKVVLNTPLHTSPELVSSIIDTYGSQSLVACVDYRLVDNTPVVYINDGTLPINITIKQHLLNIQNLGVGEVILNSIDQDGTGFGFDIPTISSLSDLLTVPLLIMGGAGNETHLEDGLKLDKVSGVMTANLFNFIGNGLPKAREYLMKKNINIASWDDFEIEVEIDAGSNKTVN